MPLRVLTPSVMSVADYLMTSSDASRAFEFWVDLVSPNSFHNMHPLYQFNSLLYTDYQSRMQRKRTVKNQLAYVFKTWNLWIAGDDVTKLVYKMQDRFPRIR
jgi:hypothetical protein